MKKILSAVFVTVMILTIAAIPAAATNENHSITVNGTIVAPTATINVTYNSTVTWNTTAVAPTVITSPEFSVENNATAPLEVKMQSFTETTPTPVSGVTLNVLNATDDSVIRSSVVGASTSATFANLDAAGGSTSSITYKFGGTYSGTAPAYGTTLLPTYSMVLNFALSS